MEPPLFVGNLVSRIIHGEGTFREKYVNLSLNSRKASRKEAFA